MVLHRRLRHVGSVLLALAIALTIASAFAYYPLSITAAPQPPPVVFEPGSNANAPDLGGKTISVTVGANGTSASVSVNPTYQETYYRDVLRVRNVGSQAFEVYLVFTSVSNTLPPGSRVKIFFYSGRAKVVELDVTNPPLNQPLRVGTLHAEQFFELDVYIYIPEGTSIGGASYTATMKLAYTIASPELRVVFVEGEGSGIPVVYDGAVRGVSTANVYDGGRSLTITADIYSVYYKVLDFFDVARIVNDGTVPAFVYIVVTEFSSTLPPDAAAYLSIDHPKAKIQIIEISENIVGTLIPYGVILPAIDYSINVHVYSPSGVPEGGAQVNISLTLIAEPYTPPEDEAPPCPLIQCDEYGCRYLWFETDFGDPATLGELRALGGSWYIDGGLLVGTDDNAGPGQASYIYLPLDLRDCGLYYVASLLRVQRNPTGVVFLSKDLAALYAVVVNATGLYVLSYNVVVPGGWHLHAHLPLEIPDGAVAELASGVEFPAPWYTLVFGHLDYVDDSGIRHVYYFFVEIAHPRAFEPAYGGLVVVDGTGEFDHLYIGAIHRRLTAEPH